EKKKLQQSLQDNEERYRNILESIEDGYYEVDLAGNLTFFNPSYSRILGYDREELLGLNNRAYMDPETVKKVFVAFNKVYKSGCPLKDLEYSLVGKDGTRKDLEISVSLIKSPEDKPIGFRGIARDISRRKEIELELEKNKENLEEIVKTRTNELARTTKFFEDIFNSSLDGIITTSLEGILLYVSPRIKDILGYELKEVMGKKFQDFFGNEAKEAEKVIEAVLEKGEIESYEIGSKKKNGEAIFLNLSISLLKHDNGEVVGITSRYRDVTEEKKMTVALAQAKEKAEAANQAKSEFLANMSHEIRTPLNGILGMSELCQETELDGEQKHHIDTIKKEADSLLEIINQILDFSKIEAGKCEIELIPFELRGLIEDVTGSFAYRTIRKGLEFVSYVSPETPDRIVGDPGRLRQVLRNLIGNAIKFTHEGEICIKIEPVQDMGDRIKLRFLIKDTGIGIPREKQGLIFESFTQVDGSTTRKYGGTGLGLTISKQLTELMGGEIGIESEEGKGATFWFTAVFVKQSETDLQMRKEVSLDQARVLVVDDSKSSRQTIVEYLRSWGAVPVETERAFEALSILKEAMAAQKPFTLV
ncbi:MAG: hypothetical protein C0407_14865, partial [Desulfobacca sp.]|nr:hypothetical protein [Desulfobacca sp.]